MEDQSDAQKQTGVRVFETKHGLKSVPIEQEGVPLPEYFKNDRLPKPLRRFDVYVTDVGPVIKKRGPVAWSREHDQRVDDMVAEAKHSITENGYYWKRTLNQARDLSGETDRSLKMVLEDFRYRFRARCGQDPGDMVDDWRRARNLPVRDRNRQGFDHQQEV